MVLRRLFKDKKDWTNFKVCYPSWVIQRLRILQHLCCMDEPFDLPVNYKGDALLFPAQLKQHGYTHRFIVNVYGQDVYFEPDEEVN